MSLHSFQAPASEEVVFRSCVLAVYHLADVKPTRAYWLTPCAFGVGKSISTATFCDLVFHESFDQLMSIMHGTLTIGMGVQLKPQDKPYFPRVCVHCTRVLNNTR
jgi:hypothetical protein